MDAGLNLFNLKKAFGNQNYTIAELSYRDKILNHPLINGLWTMGPAFVIVVNTKTWAFEMVTGESDSISGFNNDEIMNLQGKFLIDFPVENHGPANLLIVKRGMEYLNSRPVNERENIFVVYFYHARKKDGSLITIQHHSFPLIFDENHIPFIFVNVFSDIGFLKPENVPMGLIINRFTNETFEINPQNPEITASKDIFSSREKEIIRLLIKGMNSSQIAESLAISHETVRTHRKNILRKAGLSNTGQLIHYCLFNGVV